MPQTWNPETYGRDGAFVHELAGGALEWLAPQPGERILDLGCGDGQLTQRIAASGAMVIGIDASPEMVAAARARGIAADKGPAEKLPYPDHTFEAVFSNAALHWVRGQDEMMREVHRVLRPAGVLLRRWAAMAISPPSASPSLPCCRVTVLRPRRTRQLLSHSRFLYAPP